jgi:hypothetical protein
VSSALVKLKLKNFEKVGDVLIKFWVVIDLFVFDERHTPCYIDGKKTKNTNRMIVGAMQELNLFLMCDTTSICVM